MSLSDCEKCWETPCCCGHDYKDWDKDRLEKQIAMLKRVLSMAEEHLTGVDPLRETLMECVQYLRPRAEREHNGQSGSRCTTCDGLADNDYQIEHKPRCLFIRVQKLLGL